MLKEKNKNFEDEFYKLYLNSELQKSQEDIKNGNVLSLQELKKFIDGLGEKNEISNLEALQG